VELVGLPEGVLPMTQAAVYLALAPKSNAALTAYAAARKLVQERGALPVPMKLRNAPTKLMKELGFGREYRYAHDEEGAYAAGENYLPDDMPRIEWYRPTDRGLEQRIREKMAELRGRDEAAKKR
ncbi:MAG TPA: recombination factor protein RarA, partial [Burkholderiales bacterium]